jgi:predicted nucleic acid-binding protein
VLDTNVLVSGVLSAKAPPGWIVEAVLGGTVELAIDDRIRGEYEEVLRRPELRLTPALVEPLLSAIDEFALYAPAAEPCAVPLPDPADEPFLAVAAATASLLVTGHLRHFPARCRAGVEVLSPREFVDRLRRQR